MNPRDNASPARPIGAVAGWLFFLGLGIWGLTRFDACEFLTGFELVPGGRGDNRLVTALLEYWHQYFLGHGSLLSPAFYFPAQGVRGYADAFFSQALVYHLFRAWSFDPFSSFQSAVLFFNVLNYLMAFWMLRIGFGRSIPASSLGAFLFAFSAPKFNQWSHPQLQFLCGLPLVVGILAILARERQALSPLRFFLWGSIAGFALSLQLLSGFYAGAFFLLWLGLCFILSLLFFESRSFYRSLWHRFSGPLLGAGAMTLLFLSPLAALYAPVMASVGGKPYSEVEMMLPNFWTYLWMGPRHAWWGWLWDKSPALQALPVEGEMRMGFGLALSLLAIWAIAFGVVRWLKGRKKGNETEPGNSFGLAVLLGTVLLCLLDFQYGGFSPWKWVYQFVPGLSALRALGRWSVVLALPLSILLSFFLDGAWERSGKLQERWRVVAGKGFLIFFAFCVIYEQTAFPPAPAFVKRQDLARLSRLSSKLPDGSGAFYVTVKPGLMVGSYGGPLSATDVQIDAMLLSAVRGIPTLNGYSGANPPSWGLYKVRSPNYEQYVWDWAKRSGLQTSLFELEIDE